MQNQKLKKEDYTLKRWEEILILPLYGIFIAPLLALLTVCLIYLVSYYFLLLLDKQDPILTMEYLEEKWDIAKRKILMNVPAHIFCMLFWATLIVKWII